MTRILIVEDDPIISEDLAGLLRGLKYEIWGQAYDATTAFELLQRPSLPDLVLLDIELSDTRDGIDVGHMIHEKVGIPFIFLTSFADRHTLQRARQTRPAGYIVKPFEEKELFAQIEIAHYNHQNRQSTFPSLLRLNQQLPTSLTEREYDLLHLLYQGHPNRSIATELDLSTNTVKTHLKNLYVKMDATSRIDCLAKLREMG